MASKMTTKEQVVTGFLIVGAIAFLISFMFTLNHVFSEDTRRQKHKCQELAQKLNASEWKTDDNGGQCTLVVDNKLIEAGNL